MSDSEGHHNELPNEKELLGRIFEMVNQKKEAKTKQPRKKRVMTTEAKAQAVANLKKGRETSLRNRQKAAEVKRQDAPTEAPKKVEPETAKEEAPAPAPPAPTKVEPKAEEVPVAPPKPEHKVVSEAPKALPPAPAPEPKPSIDISPFAYKVYGGGGNLW